jgi:hypothetical protein
LVRTWGDLRPLNSEREDKKRTRNWKEERSCRKYDIGSDNRRTRDKTLISGEQETGRRKEGGNHMGIDGG